MNRNTQENSAGVPMKKSAVQMQKKYFTYKKKEGEPKTCHIPQKQEETYENKNIT